MMICLKLIEMFKTHLIVLIVKDEILRKATLIH